MIEVHSSLLDKVKSKYLLQKILLFAYNDVNSLLKLIRYNKNLINKLEINIKDYHKFKIKRTINKKIGPNIFNLIMYMILFFQFLAYIIMFYEKGTFNNENLIEDYNAKKKNFVDFMDNYILLPYFCFIIVVILLIIFLFLNQKIYITLKTRVIIYIIIDLIDLIHLIFYVQKTFYIDSLLKEGLSGEKADLKWFYDFNINLSIFMSINAFFYFSKLLSTLLKIYCSCGHENHENNDEKKFILNQINGINVRDFELPDEFDDLNKKEEIEIVFDKENIQKYKYILNLDQINLIKKINDIRKKYNLWKLFYSEYEILPDFIINPKLELILFPNENIYKISTNYYIFKYTKNEFQNYLNVREILNILTIGFLEEINIIEQNGIEFISIYKKNNKYNNNIDIPNNNKNTSIKIKLRDNNIANTYDKLKDEDLK